MAGSAQCAGNVFPPIYANLVNHNSGMRHSAMIDVVSGEIHPLEWKTGTTDVLPNIPMRDTVLAITDDDYVDRPVLPEAPSSLAAVVSGGSVRLRWEAHGSDTATSLSSDVLAKLVRGRASSRSRWARMSMWIRAAQT